MNSRTLASKVNPKVLAWDGACVSFPNEDKLQVVDSQHKFPRLELLDAQILLDTLDLHGALNHLQSYLQISPERAMRM